MSGGIFDKLGNWYEEDGVIWHLLLVADEQEQSLLWEGSLQDGLGVDCWITRGRERIAIQYKTKSTEPWTMADLKKQRQLKNGTKSRSVLAYARVQLTRSDEKVAGEFRFSSNESAPSLTAVIATAHAVESPAQWAATDGKVGGFIAQVFDGFGLNPNRPEDVVEAYGLVRRMRAQVVDHRTLQEQIRVLATALSSAPDLLISSLLALARSSLSTTLTTEMVRHHLAVSHVPLLARVSNDRMGVVLDATVAAFLQSVGAVRLLTSISRPESEVVANAARDTERAQTIIVHGPAGVGKTEVILQTISRLKDAKIPLLVMRAEEAASWTSSSDPVRSLRAYAGEYRACLIIDQLDQLTLAGERAQHHLIPIMMWIQLARALNIVVIVGCRTIDVDHDTQLRRVLCPDSADRYLKVPIGVLTESQATAVLSEIGIAITTLHPDLVPLTRRPIVLHLLAQLVRRGGNYSRTRTILDLVVRWWERLREPHGSVADQIMDTLVNGVERTGLLSLDRLRLQPSSVVDALITSGVLFVDGRDQVRPFHQVLVDVWLARQWSEVQSFADLRARLGSRQEQSLHHARRLRLAVLLFANLGRQGSALCNDILRSGDIRPMLKRSMLLGIAAIDAPDPSWVRQIVGWLEEPQYQGVVFAMVIYNRVAWMDALQPWITQAWPTARPEVRNSLLRLLAAVGRSRGDLVAACLGAWLQNDPTVLTQADIVFLQDPSEDSESLFELRVKHYADGKHLRDHYIKWEKLLEANAMRALRLLSHHIDLAENEELIERSPPDWLHGWPENLPHSIRITGLQTWRLLRARWARFDVEHLWQIHRTVHGSKRSDAVIVVVVDILSQVLAHALGTAEITWENLVSELPEAHRPLDDWLLLRVGAALDADAAPSGVLSAAAAWFLADPSLSRLGVGQNFVNSKYARLFLRAICPRLDDTMHHALERWVAAYPTHPGSLPTSPNPPTTEDLDAANEICFRLLASMDQRRWSSTTTELFAALTLRFGNKKPRDEDGIQFRGGWVRSDIDDSTALSLTVPEWIDKLMNAASPAVRTFPEGPEHIVLAGDVGTRIGQLRYIVPKNPNKFMDGMERFLASVPPLPEAVLEAVIDGLIKITPPDRPPPRGSWEPLDDASVEKILLIPRILASEKLAPALIEAARLRPKHEWSEAVVKRLEDLARGKAVPGISLKEDDELINYRLNERACRAVEALGGLASQHESLRPRCLNIAGDLTAHEDIGRRASAGMLAIRARSADPHRAYTLLLTVAMDDQVAAEDDIGHSLLVLARATEAMADQRSRAIEALLALIGRDDRISRRGGRSALILRAWDQITEDRLLVALNISESAREAAASTLADGLVEDKFPAVWMRELAIKFANDASAAVGEAMVRMFRNKSDHLLDIPGFFPRMAMSAAARNDPHDMLEVCCKSGDIVSISAEVLTMVNHIIALNPQTPKEKWRRESNAELAVNALLALAAKAEQVNDTMVRGRALDAWDALIESQDPSAQNMLNSTTDFSIG